MSRSHAASAKRRLKDLLRLKDNSLCADCSIPNPRWASANIGVFICMKCGCVHRSLGTNVSKVLSVSLDDWSSEDVDNMIEVGGNAAVNSIYESDIPEGVTKPGPDASHEECVKFIRSKYELQEFLKPSLRISSNADGSTPAPPAPALQPILSRKIIDTFRTLSNPSQIKEELANFIGILKVTVVKGTGLAVRDMMSSDPYVVLTFAKQTVRTVVIGSSLNPAWNETLILSIPPDYGNIKLEVFDYDTFSSDDMMGDAEVDIRPLIRSAMAYGDPENYQDMQIGKWLSAPDNALVEDSPIMIIDGRVKQEMKIKLQNVECGEIDLDITYLAND